MPGTRALVLFAVSGVANFLHNGLAVSSASRRWVAVQMLTVRWQNRRHGGREFPRAVNFPDPQRPISCP
jgi:hypothetical protein